MKKNRSGFTLVEVMIVIFIIGILSATVTIGFTSIFSKDSREIALDFTSNVKYLFDRANFTNSYVRIVFDFKKNTYEVSASKERVLLFGKKRKVALGEVQENIKEEKRKELIEEEEKKASEANSFIKSSTPLFNNNENNNVPIFSQHSMKRYKSARFDKILVDEDLNFDVEIPKNVKIAGVYTEYYDDYVTEGKAEIIIFPNSYIQRSIVVFQDVNSEDYISVLIEPYSGYSKIIGEYYKLSKEEEEIEDD